MRLPPQEFLGNIYKTAALGENTSSDNNALSKHFFWLQLENNIKGRVEVYSWLWARPCLPV
jgi:hypothetical protein